MNRLTHNFARTTAVATLAGLALVATTLAQTADPPHAQSAPASQPTPASGSARHRGLAPPPALSDRDILRLKLHEFPLEGEPDKVNVRFTMGDERKTVEDLLLAQLADDPTASPDWSKILRTGSPPERLQVVLAATGVRFLDRIVVTGDPRVFDEYRRTVLPLLTRGCLRSGCHGGSATHAFRFPVAPPKSDGYVYTSFYLLDQLETADGSLINRAVPEASVLLAYLLPPTADGPKHPPVKREKLNPAIPKRDSAEHKALLDWLESLRVERVYELEYQPPTWLNTKPQSQPASQPGSQP
ncbi:MAG: hypothetical protein ACKVS9_19300 [Phycisphaerae bacterium]